MIRQPRGLGLFALFAIVLLAPQFVFAANLVSNGDLEVANGTVPSNWVTDSWGTLTAAFTYPAAGFGGTKGAQVTISKFTSGDAKWYFNHIPVTVGTTYQISDNFSSTVATEVDVEFHLSNGSYSYVVLGTPASTAGAWSSFAGSVVVPASATTMSVLHLLDKVGTLTIDNMQVTSGTTPPPPPVQKPVIASFIANPASIGVGSSTQLNWSITGASSTVIDQGVGTVIGTSVIVSPSTTTVYTITATNPGGNTSTSTTVTVVPLPPPPPPPTPAKPIIASFIATPASIALGSSTSLSWSVTGASSTSINQGVGVVTGASQSVSPSTTTIYTLTATNGGGSVSTTTTVTVVQPPPPPPATTTNLVVNGNLESGTTGSPQGWAGDYWGSMTAKFNYPVTGNSGGKAAQIVVSNYNSGAANWAFTHIPSNSHNMYQFTEDYNATAATELDIEFRMSDGTYRYDWLSSLPASGGWKTFTGQVTVPPGAVSFTVLHLMTHNGTLNIDNVVVSPITNTFSQGMVTLSFDDGLSSQYTQALPILTTAGLKGGFYIITNEPTSGDSGYMTWAQIKDLAAKGHEVGGHTRTHPALTTLTTAQAQTEIAGSFNDLVAQGLTPKTFVYPVGDVNQAVEAQVKAAGYIGARGSYFGQNVPQTDRYDIYDIRIDASTNLATIKSYIDQAKADKRWVVFELHDVKTGGDSYAITPSFFQLVVTYLKQTGVSVVTMQEGMQLMNP